MARTAPTGNLGTKTDIQDSTYTYDADVGVSDAYAITLDPAPDAYVEGQSLTFKANTANTGAASLNVNGLGAITIKKKHDQDLSTGDIESGSIVEVVYDGTNFQMVSQLASPAAGGGGGGDNPELYVSAKAMSPTISNPSATLSQVEITAGQPDVEFLGFDDSADEHVQFEVVLPSNWNAGTVTFIPYWTADSAVANGVAWALQGVALADNDAIGQAYGTAVVVTDTHSGTANDLNIGAESSAITIANTPTAGDVLYFRLFRDVSDVGDTLVGDARLLGILVKYTRA